LAAQNRRFDVIEFAFVRVIFVVALVAIGLQCAVYPVRRLLGWGAARRLLSVSLFGFLGMTAACLVWGASNGQLARGLALGGWKTLADLGLFIGFAMFIAYFMGDRYLADELERARVAEHDGAPATAPAASDEPGGEV